VRLGLGPVTAHFFVPSAVGLEFGWRVAGSARSWCHLLASALPAPVPALRPSCAATFPLGVLRPTQCFRRPDFGAAVDFPSVVDFRSTCRHPISALPLDFFSSRARCLSCSIPVLWPVFVFTSSCCSWVD
jgi:hypothetical protein